MTRKPGLFALVGTAVGLGVGVAAEHSVIRRHRRDDPEGEERFGSRRGTRSRRLIRPDGAEIFVEETGQEGATRGLVFVHGSALRTDMWHYQMDEIEGYRCVFYDLRGHGLSQPRGAFPYTIATLAADLCAVIEDAGLTEVIVIGHSAGGMIALQLAFDVPELLAGTVKGLVLANSTYKPAAETLLGGAILARMERLVRRPLDVIGSQSRQLDRLRALVPASDGVFWSVTLAAFGPNPSARHVDFTYDMVAGASAGVIFELVRAYRGFDARDGLDQVTVPVLVMGGTHDRLTVPAASEYLASHLPECELVMLEDCGHMMMLERHRDFSAHVQRFAGRVFGGSGSARGKGNGLRARSRKDTQRQRAALPRP